MPSYHSAFAALLARAPSAYHFLAQVARDGWAWEFLRRNMAYRSTCNHPAPGASAGAWDLCSFRRSLAVC